MIITSLFCALIFFLIKSGKYIAYALTRKTRISKAIEGNWELRISSEEPDSLNGSCYLPGNGNMWKFTGTTYHMYFAGQQTSSGNYTMKIDKCPATGKLLHVINIIWDRNYDDKILIQTVRDTLIMYRGAIAADRAFEQYVRI